MQLRSTTKHKSGTIPSVIFSHANGYKLEELVKGKPDGKKAVPGARISVRYIGKLQKNGNIFVDFTKTPFEFILGSGEVLEAFEFGVGEFQGDAKAKRGKTRQHKQYNREKQELRKPKGHKLLEISPLTSRGDSEPYLPIHVFEDLVPSGDSEPYLPIHIQRSSLWAIQPRIGDSWNWKCLLSLRDLAEKFVTCKVRNGFDAAFWFDNWSPLGPLIKVFGDNGPRDLRAPLNAKVADLWDQTGWLLAPARSDAAVSIHSHLTTIGMSSSPDVKDSYYWTINGLSSDKFSSKLTWDSIRPREDVKDWYKSIWFKGATPRFAFTMWTANLDRLPTKARLESWGMLIPTTCSLCFTQVENRDHLFLHCDYSNWIWSQVHRKLDLQYSSFTLWTQLMTWLKQRTTTSPPTLRKLVTQTVIYAIWRERSNRFFKHRHACDTGFLPGVESGVEGMLVGGKRRITIPPLMGYGKPGDGKLVPPHAWLVFDVELLDVRPGSSMIEATSDVTTHDNGLTIQVLVKGTPDGKIAVPGKWIRALYSGKLQKNGETFDSKFSKIPKTFRLGDHKLGLGFDFGITGMHVGEIRKITIPPVYGFVGKRVPPHAWLVFQVELVEVVDDGIYYDDDDDDDDVYYDDDDDDVYDDAIC